MSINSWGSDDPAEVAKGGSGRTSSTAYSVICGGTDSTSAHQSVSSVGTSGQVLTSNGAAALPTFQASTGGGGGGQWSYVDTFTASSEATLDITDLTASSTYLLRPFGLLPETNDVDLRMRASDDNGVTFSTGSDYQYYYRQYFPSFTTQNTGTLNGSYMELCRDVGNYAINYGVFGEIVFSNMNVAGETASYYSISGLSSKHQSGREWNSVIGNGSTSDSSGNNIVEVDAIRFYFSSGDIVSGSVYVYKLVTS